jgi:pilus assembly protein CpaD
MTDPLAIKGARGTSSMGAPVLAVFAIALLSGCTMHQRDSVIVGSVPDDYRTNHPIVISERAEVLDIPVGIGQDGMTNAQRTSIEGFLANYDKSAAPAITIMVPSGSANEVVAGYVAGELAHVIVKNGIPDYKIVTAAYAADPNVAAPIRITYAAMRASVGKCGRWPGDLMDHAENRHYANFGCSYQNNLAAQIANPADLLGPRQPGEIDATRRGVIIDIYQNSEPDTSSEIDY